MTVVRLAAEERLLAAYARYDRAWAVVGSADLVPARLELCRALLDCGELLPPEVQSQMARDGAALDKPHVITV